MKRLIAGLMLLCSVVGLMGCNDAEIASANISRAADNFEITRRIIFYNGITGDYILTIEGRCSQQPASEKSDGGKRLAVICKTGPSAFKKHFLGLSDNVTYFSEQLEESNASVYRYRVVFKPTVIVPDFNMGGGGAR